MKIAVELPTWLGDTVMASEAFEHIASEADSIALIGSYLSTQAFAPHPKVSSIHTIQKRKDIFKVAKEVGRVDMAISFRSHLPSRLLLWLLAKKRFLYRRQRGTLHQVIRYHNFVEKIFQKRFPLHHLKLHYKPKKFAKPTIGINPGATYGSAKRWYPEYFAEVANTLGSDYHYIIFGGPNESDIAQKIAHNLKVPFTNLAGKTTIPQLIEHIAGCNLFITNDSGPMHVAAAYDVPIVALFGPTNDKETSPFTQKSRIVKLDLECMPCMKRVCPLQHHKCMKDLTPSMVVKAAKELL